MNGEVLCIASARKGLFCQMRNRCRLERTMRTMRLIANWSILNKAVPRWRMKSTGFCNQETKSSFLLGMKSTGFCNQETKSYFLLGMGSLMFLLQNPPLVKCSGDTPTENNDVSNEDSKETKQENDDECPICRFFLQSPCRDAFEKFNQCIQVSLDGDVRAQNHLFPIPFPSYIIQSESTKEKPNPDDEHCMEPFRPFKKCMDENNIEM